MKKVEKIQGKVYKHLDSTDREEISIMLAQGFSQNDIAMRINRHPSTISREIRRNGSSIRSTRYRSNRAQQRADDRNQLSHAKIRLKSEIIQDYVVFHIKQGMTPEQIAGRIGIDLPGCSTNYESIYLFIYNERPDLTVFLVYGKRKRQKRPIKQGKRMVKIPNRVMISERPEDVNSRQTYGHWEADTVISRKSKSALVVVRERKMHITLIKKIPRKTAAYMKKAVIQMLRRFPPSFVITITFDNGLENAGHESIAKALGVDIYFCNPYHSWEKGGVENGIGLIRRYFPKKTDFELISHQSIRKVEIALNNRPRKSLGFLTPLEVYENCA